MIYEYLLRVQPHEAASEETLKKCVCRQKGLNESDITSIQVLKRSVDARQKNIFLQISLRVFVNELPTSEEAPKISYQDVSSAKSSVIVVGAGPAGLFAALKLIELGIKPIVVERGKKVSERKRDIASSIRSQHIQPESNICYGEGGAGAFSDGKLYTRSKKRGNVNHILQIFHQFGASPNILIDAHPHIGTDKLPGIIANIREQILQSGGEMYFETRMTDLLMQGNKVVGILCEDGKEFQGPVILATGHSAKDVYYLLKKKSFHLEAKGIAMGVRLEHPQMLIDQLMYHQAKGRGEYLPAAEYSFVNQINGRGVYSFCMCPGGFVLPAGEQDGIIVVNGMSPSNRGSKWANSGMVVEIRPEDFPKFSKLMEKYVPNEADALLSEDIVAPKDHTINLLRLQQAYERLSYEQAADGLKAPAQRMIDFVQGKASQNLPGTSYISGLVSSPLHEWIPKEIRYRLQQGFQLFDKSIKGFLSNEAQLIAAETRTSSPIRLTRDENRKNLIDIEGLYPCGEGAGYAGGIVSSAIDGEICAESVLQIL